MSSSPAPADPMATDGDRRADAGGSSLHVDRDLCMGSGSCAFQAPAMFDLDDEMKVVRLDGSDSADALRAAVESCPSGALRLVTRSEPGEIS
ncbi:(4Fe-4S)-binding protein [Frankia sp. CcI49]|uniref:ferredoxin n=1 Tax=Frankia sp. CcI49 TaxID=1745382 RepID=UPI00268EAF98